jgi:flavin reductase (DIM6/NTAB) family NADH-FMN oxidoreductase RutF
MSRQLEELRGILGCFATGVTVLTTLDRAGRPCGTTANSFTSVSLQPPLILVCLAVESRTLEAIETQGTFVANILAADQQGHSDFFARRGIRLDPEQHELRSGQTGLPILEGTLAHLECDVERIDEGGDHRIVLGRVKAHEQHRDDVDPLIFFRSSYHSPPAIISGVDL